MCRMTARRVAANVRQDRQARGCCLGARMNPGDVVPLSFNGGLVALSFLTAVLGSYVALLAAVGIRTETQDGDIRLGYILIGAVAMGGVGIWSMHFIGMQAQDLPFLVGYQVGLTVLSFLVAAGFSGWAFWYVGRDRFTIGRCRSAAWPQAWASPPCIMSASAPCACRQYSCGICRSLFYRF